MTVTIGTPVLINAVGSNPIDITQLSATQSMIIYEDNARLKARVLTNGNPPTANAEVDIDATSITGDDAVLVAVTSTSAMVIYDLGGVSRAARMLTVSGTTITVNAATALTNTPINTSNYSCALIDTSRVLHAYYDSTAGRANAVVLSISGTTITENTIINVSDASSKGGVKCSVFSTSRAFISYVRISTAVPQGVIVSISGNTLTANTQKDVAAITVRTDEEDTYNINMSATKAVLGLLDFPNVVNYVITLNGVTFDVGTQASDPLTLADNLSAAKLSSTSLVTVNETSTNTMKAVRYDITGAGSDELTKGDSDTLSGITSLDTIRCAPIDSSNIMVHYIGSSNSAVQITSITVNTDYSLAAMTKPADVDAAGSNIYLALLDSGGFPVVIKIGTALTADGTTVFDPGAGDNIGVECGRFNSDVVWVAGNFDGTNVIEKSEDGGSTFTVADDGTIGDIRTFVMGPDSDDRLLVFDETNGDILETRDGGVTWKSINAAVTPEVNAIGRLGENVQETVFGNQGAANNSIDYSVNSGDDLEDYQTGVYPNANATRVIVN